MLIVCVVPLLLLSIKDPVVPYLPSSSSYPQRLCADAHLIECQAGALS